MARKTLQLDKNPLLGGPSLDARVKTGSPYRELAIADIDVDPEQPRRSFDADALAELALSIKEHGVINPILVRVAAGGTFRVVAGERRLRAAKLAGLDTIPAIVDTTEERDEDTLAKQLVENLQRADLGSMERAVAIGQLRDRYSLSIRDIASRLGVSKALVQRSLEVLALPEDLQAALENGASESKVLLLAQVTDLQKRSELLRRIESLTRAQLEQEIQLAKGGEASYHRGTGTPTRAAGQVSADDKRLAEEIQRILGTRVEIQRKRGKEGQGRISIEFYSAEDFQEIYRRLVAD